MSINERARVFVITHFHDSVGIARTRKLCLPSCPRSTKRIETYTCPTIAVWLSFCGGGISFGSSSWLPLRSRLLGCRCSCSASPRYQARARSQVRHAASPYGSAGRILRTCSFSFSWCAAVYRFSWTTRGSIGILAVHPEPSGCVSRRSRSRKPSRGRQRTMLVTSHL
jgi:hypothetical protein